VGGGVATAAPSRRPRWLLLELLLLAAGAAVVLALTLVSPPKPPAPAFAPAVLGGQPEGAVVLAQEDKDLALALAVQPGRQRLALVATILGQDGTGANGLDVGFRTTTHDGAVHESDGRPCGPGCYGATVATQSRPTAVAVTLTGPGSSDRPRRFVLPAQWPPRPATDLVHSAERAFRRLTTLVTHERLGSDPTHVLDTTYRAVAPDKLQIVTRHGPESIVIGKTRWDRQPGGPWRRTRQSSPIHAIAPYWAGGIEDATLLGTATVRGRPTWVVSFAAPQFPAFFTIWIDKASHRVLQLEMTASAHFMHHTYGPFDKQLSITPPQRARSRRRSGSS
jgi:hypothetical protein